ncbi:hypothetical protein [Pseudoxanthomonas sp. PXM02]|uniref:hypothetical protein n=1 Tax=Pseudoxanthomonas sp. PXM02 TaxID=2769294 RepID=UPI001781E99A|nr:hypothetical protein [Pseudoxanthomonas sp. PXM02]MBD9478871.1 hypothetical protein [Pseudoxanthomonas sp. PXM02]
MSTKQLKKCLSQAELELLIHACTAITRILPHVEVVGWVETKWMPSGAVWASTERQKITFVAGVKARGIPSGRALEATIRRRRESLASGVAKSTLDGREHNICALIAEEIGDIFSGHRPLPEVALPAVTKAFDERIVARHLAAHHEVTLPVGEMLNALHTLAEQTYENKAVAFGCVVEPRVEVVNRSAFPKEFLKLKKFKALSDGYRTAYVVSGNGAIIRFVDLDRFSLKPLTGKHFYPEWAEAMAKASRDRRFGIVLSRQGDVLVLEEGTLRFSYRFGKWQYWNHGHLVNLIRDWARAQKIRKSILGNVVGAIYRAAIDVSFRRTGGLFVILKNQAMLKDVVKAEDVLGGQKRSTQDAEFDLLLKRKTIQSLPRRVMVELAALDGALVINKSGTILAYGAVIQPKRAGRLKGAEGSRTKAAIGASNYGMAVKISSDGDITVYKEGQQYLTI